MKPYDLRSILQSPDTTTATVRLSKNSNSERLIAKLDMGDHTIDQVCPILTVDDKGKIDTSRAFYQSTPPQFSTSHLVLLYRIYMLIMSILPIGTFDKIKVGSIIFDQGRTLSVKQQVGKMFQVHDVFTGEEFLYRLVGSTFVMDPVIASTFKTIYLVLSWIFGTDQWTPLNDKNSVEPLITKPQLEQIAAITINAAMEGTPPEKIVTRIKKSEKLRKRREVLSEIVNRLNLSYSENSDE